MEDADPELRLLAAILIRATRDAMCELVHISKTTQDEARRWFYLHDVEPEFRTGRPIRDGFSFHYICQHLGLNPETIHSNLRAYIAANEVLLCPAKSKVDFIDGLIDEIGARGEAEYSVCRLGKDTKAIGS